MDVDTHARRPGHDRGREHVTRAARVLADDDRSPDARQTMGRGAAQGVGMGWLQVDVGYATDSIRAEESRQRVLLGG